MSKLSRGIKKLERSVSQAIPHQHSADRRAMIEATRQQIDAYKEQREMMRNEANQINQERETERTRVRKQQISQMRQQYRTPGFLDEAGSSSSERLG